MIIGRFLSGVTVASDILQATLYSLSLQTSSIGGFLSINTLNYMDAVIGSMREKRSSASENGVSVSKLKKIEKGEGFTLNGIFFYRTMVDWYVGLDSPLLEPLIVSRYIERDVEIAYPTYTIITKQEDKNGERDPLTGFFTRGKFFNHIKSNFLTLLSRDIPLYIFYMDFNNFKIVNDTLGHNMGDQILSSIAMEIKKKVPSSG